MYTLYTCMYLYDKQLVIRSFSFSKLVLVNTWDVTVHVLRKIERWEERIEKWFFFITFLLFIFFLFFPYSRLVCKCLSSHQRKANINSFSSREILIFYNKKREREKKKENKHILSHTWFFSFLTVKKAYYTVYNYYIMLIL